MMFKLLHSRDLWKFLLLSNLLLMITKENDAVVFKMTNAVCESYNKSWVEMGQCRLKAVQRNKVLLNIDLNILHPANAIEARLEIQKKGNGYKPWLFDYKVDGCRFMRKGFNPAVKMLWEIFKDYSTINHSCPYMGYQSLKDFYPQPNRLLNPLPTGDYLFVLTLSFDKSQQPTMIFKVYFSFVEDL